MSEINRKSILNPAFKYVPAASTDLRKTFARELRRLAAEQAERKVLPMRGRK